MHRSKSLHVCFGLLSACLLLVAAPAQAKIDLVTLPGRDQTQITIYKAEDLTLVREIRSLTFSEGKNEIQFSWANTFIDPTSLQIRMVKNSPQYKVLDASYPANTQNTIVWNIEASEADVAQVEITYFASGVNWRADYAAYANNDETMIRLEPNFTVFNNSGEDFENAVTRLVVGEINLVQAIRDLARKGLILEEDGDRLRERLARGVVMEQEAQDWALFAGGLAGDMPEEAKQIVKAAVSEYYLYSISGTEDLETGWGKQLPDPAIDEIPIDVSYEYNPRKYGNQVVKFYKFKNDEEHELGQTPLPQGIYYVFSDDGRDGLRFQAMYDHKYIPVGEDIELQLGSDGLVLLEHREMSHQRENFDYDRYRNIVGHDVRSVQEIEIRNSKDRAIPIKITWPMGGGDWEIVESSDAYKKVDQQTVEWELSVPAFSKTVIELTVVEHKGTRSKAN